MNCYKNIGKLYYLLIGLIVLQSGFLCLTESSSPLHTDNASSTILQPSPSSPIHHDHATHLMGIFELEEDDDRLEENDFLREAHLIKSTTDDFTTPLLPLLVEKHLISVANLPIYLVDKQFRL